jgi:hypothetical protein
MKSNASHKGARKRNGVGSDPRCKSCQSARRLEIDRRLLEGQPTRAVSAWLSEQGEKIRFESLAKHKKRHLAVVERARERIEAAEAQAAAEVDKIVASAELLDEAAGMALTIARSLVETMIKKAGEYNKWERPGQVDAMLFEGMVRELRQIVKTKHEMKHGKDVNLNGLGLIEFLAKFGGGAGEGEGGAGPVAT